MTKRERPSHVLLNLLFATAPNVTVTVMLSGGTPVEHQLRGLQRGTLYTVKVLSQKDSLQSMAISTTFTTANGKSGRIQGDQVLYSLDPTDIACELNVCSFCVHQWLKPVKLALAMQ